jgi:15-cis-phytoene synthase
MDACRRITRKSASNLALAFVLLPKDRRDAMAALYAFCREVDDVSDNEGRPANQRREQLAAWRADIKAACQQGHPQFEVNQELMPVIAQYRLPFELFDELIRGVEMDLDINRYPTWTDLELYCYRVASVVGLLSIEIFGYQQPGTKEYAVNLGKALQLTNILRDVRVDAERGRIYLPLSELEKFKVAPEEILQNRVSDNFRALAASVARQARTFYRQASATLPAADRRAMSTAELMGTVYWRLLRKIENSHFDVLAPKLIRLSKPRKLGLILRALVKQALGNTTSDYGQ